MSSGEIKDVRLRHQVKGILKKRHRRIRSATDEGGMSEEYT